MAATTITSDPIAVLYVESDTGPAGAKAAFDRLESAIGTLKGRKFYGAYYPPDGPYRAYVAARDGDDAAALGLLAWQLPGGAYRREKIADWPEHIADIGPTFARMARNAAHAGMEFDSARPSIEFYRSERALHLLLPVRSPTSAGPQRDTSV